MNKCRTTFFFERHSMCLEFIRLEKGFIFKYESFVSHLKRL